MREKQKASNKRWDEKNLARRSLAIPVALDEAMKAHVAKTGESINGFIRRAIERALKCE